MSPSQWDVPSQYGSPVHALRSGAFERRSPHNSESPIRNYAESDAMVSLPQMSMSGVSVAKPIRRDHRGEKHSQRAGDARFPASKPRRVSTLSTPSPPEPTLAANTTPSCIVEVIMRLNRARWCGAQPEKPWQEWSGAQDLLPPHGRHGRRDPTPQSHQYRCYHLAADYLPITPIRYRPPADNKTLPQNTFWCIDRHCLSHCPRTNPPR